MAEIHGTCDERFETVREALAANFDAGLEVGASAAVVLDGELVADVWGGVIDDDGTPWQRDTIINVYSTTKGMTALCAHVLMDRGQLDVDAPVARYWPEFAQAGKGDIPVRWLLSHRAGLSAIREPLPIEALYALRYHSFYPWHKEGDYDYLANDQDREMLKWVRAFNRYDLYSKGDGRPDAKALRPYYEDLVNEFFPTPLQW